MSTTYPQGFIASGVSAGLKKDNRKDVAIVLNQGPNFDASAVFTSNKIKAAPVLWTQEIIKNKKLKAVFLNSGGANACTGAQGFQDTHKTAELVAQSLNIGAIEVAVCSTGLIGLLLDMTKVEKGIQGCVESLHKEGGIDAADAIITTDSHSKVCVSERNGYSYGAMIKGAGMLAPDMATMLCVITTDADISDLDHQQILIKAVAKTLNRIDSDGCTSTNDTVIFMSSGKSGKKIHSIDLEEDLIVVLNKLGAQLINDAEGSTKSISITVKNSASETDAVNIARSIARNNLLKCALFGEDPNWGRILAALGNAEAQINPDTLDVYLNSTKVCENGAAAININNPDLSMRDIRIDIDLKIGNEIATIYTNDLSINYVHENSAYST
jgi:glutamate N-acetyltransferase/amino-acid N-acetyltransferase